MEELARKEVGRIAFINDIIDDTNDITPIMRIGRDGKVTFRNTERHPAQYRCPGIAHFVQKVVLPLTTADRVAGEYRFEPHDAVQSARTEPTLAFARNFKDPAKATNVVVFPDYYQMFEYDGLLNKAGDTIPWNMKIDKVLFAGTTTGSTDPFQNVRIKSCLWAMNKERYNFKLTSVRQMAESDLIGAYGTEVTRSIIGPYVTPEEHHRYRYNFNIEGNTCCWSRLPMIMKSNSLLLNLAHDEGNWFYPLLRDSFHYVNVQSLQDLDMTLDWCDKHQDRCIEISKNAKDFASQFCTQRAAAEYAKTVLELMSDARMNYTHSQILDIQIKNM